MAKKSDENTTNRGTAIFPQDVIYQFWASNNMHDEEGVHDAIMFYLDDIENGLSNDDSVLYGTAFFILQTIANQLDADSLDLLKDYCSYVPFLDVVDIILKNREGFIELTEELDPDNILAMILKVPFCYDVESEFNLPNFSNFNVNNYRKSTVLAQLAVMALVDSNGADLTYADLGAGYADFSMMLAACGVPCKSSSVCEKDKDAVKVAAARLCLTDYRTIFEIGDIFNQDWDRSFDRIFCEPAFSDKYDDISKEYMKHVEKQYGYEVSNSDHDWLYALCAAERLNENGKALIVVRQKALEDSDSENGRRILLEQKLIAGIVKLPSYMKHRANEELALVVLRKGSDNVVLHDSEEVDNRGDLGKLDGYSSTKLVDILRSL